MRITAKKQRNTNLRKSNVFILVLILLALLSTSAEWFTILSKTRQDEYYEVVKREFFTATSEKQDKNETASSSKEESAYRSEEENDVMAMEYFEDIWHRYDCDDFFESETPIPPISAWTSALEVYKTKFFSEDNARFHSNFTSDAPRHNGTHTGFSVMVEAKQSPGKGRGIFAAQGIKKGELIWSPKYSVSFDANGIEYKQFLMSLDPAFVCNALQCSSLEDYSGNGTELFRISIELDEGCFVNADYSGTREFVNMGCLENNCEHHYALRDVKKGEELLNAYEDFSYEWEPFDVESMPELL